MAHGIPVVLYATIIFLLMNHVTAGRLSDNFKKLSPEKQAFYGSLIGLLILNAMTMLFISIYIYRGFLDYNQPIICVI